MRLVIETYNLQAVERMLCVEALNQAGTIVDAASLLGITRHALKRRIIKHNIEWPVRRPISTDTQGIGQSAAPVVSAPISAAAE
ncbi:MAG: helix-turn-helix domain-containing protein [Nannocystaceae bacterium]